MYNHDFLKKYVDELILEQERTAGKVSGITFYDPNIFIKYHMIRNKDCGNRTGVDLSRCKMDQARDAMTLLKRVKVDCARNSDPNTCRQNADALIAKWQSKYDFFRSRELKGG